MNKFASLLAAPLCVVAMSLPAAAEKLSLGELSRYLNGLNTASADFTQINDDGTISTGKLFLKRPGRMRFEYNPPEKTLVLASAGAVAIFDPKTNQGPESYPLNRTPLSIILARNVDLARANMVVGHGYDGTATTVTAQDPEHPEYGNIQLVFTGAPVQLRQWVINDDAGNSTTVVLGAMQSGQGLSDTLFNIQLATQRPIR
ncbi:LolA family protein [Thalassovita taeanensis]|uniref:Outer membrane lipoprotein-sorting protein n=1 Tax=Thalassovita taeanensis TaxID=657014 RepID=A0A1H9I7I3_9RHOB|nr:outer membrane lipoprotein carrier protein LolA [Thalassovita taeanensis]SEQ70355.1 Outer membrane lipoprotein-sorting protein [Thalassovita taeanensis]